VNLKKNNMLQIINKAKSFVKNLLEYELSENLYYHNLDHTLRVYKSTKEIINHSTLSEKETISLEIAALFHDTGYTVSHDSHEEESVKIATNFLLENNVEQSIIDIISNCILATKFDVEPKNELEKIIKDADCSHFAQEDFKEISESLRKELKITEEKDFSKNEWNILNLALLKFKHKFYTEYAKTNWGPLKKQNIQKLMDEKANRKKAKEQERKLKEELKSQNPERAIQSVYRITLRNHIKLSDIADTKANILLSINAIIISIALSTLIPKLDNPSNQHLILPTVIFIVFTIITIGLSVLATRPNVTSGKFTKEDVVNKKVNLLFFGNFYKMNLDEYEWAINEMIKDKDYMYSSMTKDLYFLGKVLNRKYTILRRTYTIFLIGIIISITSFALAIYMTNNS
jgi:predicted metal-dependent HD superfamily phosphohydrolase